MVSHWSLSNCKFSQVTRLLLSILADLYNAVVWMVSNSHICKCFSPLINLLGIVPVASILFGITVTFTFHICPLARFRYLSFVSLSFIFFYFLCGSAGRQSSLFNKFSGFFFLQSLGLADGPRLGDPFISQNPRESCASHPLEWVPGCPYTTYSLDQFFFFSEFSLHYFSYPVLCSLTPFFFGANLLHSFII